VYSVSSTQGDDDVSGKVEVRLKRGKKLEHQGIKVELVGRIEMVYERSQTSDFISISRDLEPPGTIFEDKVIPFNFAKVDKQFETYRGINVRLRYFVKLTVLRSYASNVVKESDFAVQAITPDPDSDQSIKMEVGIEDCLHIEFEYNKRFYHLKDCIVGKVFFLLVRIRIKHMEIAIIKRETLGAGQAATSENETVAKYEVMDGAPVRGECIPIRVFLGAYDLTPTYMNVNNRFSVRYYLNLVLIDEEDRRYFKQQEISLWRKSI
jgi:vacuolar protein sorting-associated protein 26